LSTHQYIEQIAEFIAPQDRFGLIDDRETLNIMPFKIKAASTHWELMFTWSLVQTTDITRQHDILSEVANLLDAGKIRSTATEVLGKINAATLKRAVPSLRAIRPRVNWCLKASKASRVALRRGRHSRIMLANKKQRRKRDRTLVRMPRTAKKSAL
jgi:hypothetical protein